MGKHKPRPNPPTRGTPPPPRFSGKWPRSAGFVPLDEPRTLIVPSNAPRTERETSAPRPRAAFVTGATPPRSEPVYQGTAMLGIATMHKSNAVPVFTSEAAQELARMRR